METVKMSIDELALMKASIIDSQKKHTKGTAMFSFYEDMIEKIKTISQFKSSFREGELVIISMPLVEARDMMQDIQTVVITGTKTDRKVKVLKFVSQIWNKIFESKESLFERQG